MLNKETGAQSSEVTWPRSHSQEVGAWNPGLIQKPVLAFPWFREQSYPAHSPGLGVSGAWVMFSLTALGK